MTTAQPGQEQRMVTDAMIEAGDRAMADAMNRTGPMATPLAAKEIYAAMEAARPTADLGDDGEIVDRVAGWLDKQRVECAPSTLVGVATPVDELEELLIFARQQADRLILYREALGEAQEQVDAYGYRTVHGRRVRQSWATELLAKIDAVLSRSGL